MAKFKIAQDPTFGAQVHIPRVGSKSIEVGFTFKYLDRLQLAAFVDRVGAEGKELSEASASRSVEDQAKAEISVQVAQLLDVVAAWDFEDELSEEGIRNLATTFSGAPDAVMRSFYDAYHKARLGN